jgi:hypothetical protein
VRKKLVQQIKATFLIAVIAVGLMLCNALPCKAAYYPNYYAYYAYYLGLYNSTSTKQYYYDALAYYYYYLGGYYSDYYSYNLDAYAQKSTNYKGSTTYGVGYQNYYCAYGDYWAHYPTQPSGVSLPSTPLSPPVGSTPVTTP